MITVLISAAMVSPPCATQPRVRLACCDDTSGLFCRADGNRDGEVDILDLNLVLASFGRCKTPCCPGNVLGCDRVVDQKDVDLVLAQWGQHLRPSKGAPPGVLSGQSTGRRRRR